MKTYCNKHAQFYEQQEGCDYCVPDCKALGDPLDCGTTYYSLHENGTDKMLNLTGMKLKKAQGGYIIYLNAKQNISVSAAEGDWFIYSPKDLSYCDALLYLNKGDKATLRHHIRDNEYGRTEGWLVL